MPSVTERVYPDDMDESREIQRILKEVFLRRYSLARDWLRGLLGDRKLRVLDIACGSGFGTAILGELGEAVGVDIDLESIDYAKSHYEKPNVQFLAGNAHDTTFVDSLGQFDAVVSSGTIEHLDDPMEFLRWIKKVLRPDGACVLAFPSTFTMDWAAPFHKRDISAAEAERMFAEVGFRVHEQHVEGHRMRIGDLKSEIRENKGIPVPPLSQWIGYYITHPHHFLIRLYQITIGPGVLFQDQEYLITPT
jgi:SAM-dependent methyltransferase